MGRQDYVRCKTDIRKRVEQTELILIAEKDPGKKAVLEAQVKALQWVILK